MPKNMTKGNLAKALIVFSIPLILSGVLQQMYNWADAFIVGHAEGENALAAIGATHAITSLLIMALTGFTSGVSILSARYFGTEDLDAQKKILYNFLMVLGSVFLCLSILGVTLAKPVLTVLQTPSDIFELSKTYLQITMLGIPFLTIYNVYSAVLRGIGDSKAPFYAVLVSSVVNVVLDILFVTILGWSVTGAALATVLSQVIMTIFIVMYAIKRYEMLRFHLDKTLKNSQILRQGMLLSLPIAIQSLVTSGGDLILQGFMNGFGTITVAAITTAYRVDRVILIPVVNLGTGIATVTSQNLGAGEYDRVKKCLFIGTGVTAAFSVCLSVVVVLFGGNLVALFGVSPESVEIGAEFFKALGCYYFIYALVVAFRGYLEGIGQVQFSSIIDIISLGVRIFLSYALVSFFGNMVIAYAEAFSWCFLLIAYLLWFACNRKKTTWKALH